MYCGNYSKMIQFQYLQSVKLLPYYFHEYSLAPHAAPHARKPLKVYQMIISLYIGLCLYSILVFDTDTVGN